MSPVMAGAERLDQERPCHHRDSPIRREWGVPARPSASRQRRWIERKVDKTLLDFDRKPHDTRVFNCPMCSFPDGGK
jgi:hypothetical protein